MDSSYIRTMSIGVSDFNNVQEAKKTTQGYTGYRDDIQLTYPWEPDKYQISAPLDEQYNILDKDFVFFGSSGTSERATGWYFRDIGYCMRIIAYIDNYRQYTPLLDTPPIDMEVKLQMPDQYLVIDGQMVTFLEFRGEPETSYKTEDITMPNGAPARVYTLEGRQHFLGKNFYVAAIDTLYQLTPEQAATSSGNPVRHSAPAHKSSRPNTLRTSQLPPPYRTTPFVEYGGAPRGMKVPPMRVTSVKGPSGH